MNITDRYQPASAERFTRDTDGFTMTVLHDDGVYRHLRYRHPTAGSAYWYDLVTWPGCLTFRGDVGCYTFARTHDMVTFFDDHGYANAHYWAEKLQGGRGRPDVKVWSPSSFRQHVGDAARDYLDDHPDEARDLWADLRTSLLDGDWPLDQHDAISTAMRYRHHAFDLDGAWEWDCTEWDWAYLWACQGIRAGLALYRAHVAAQAPAVAAAECPA